MSEELNKDRYIDVDPLRPAYRESIIEAPERKEAIRKGNIALLCIDMQYLDAVRGHGVFAEDDNRKVPVQSIDYYFEMLESTVLPNVRKLQDTFRSHNLEVIHIRIQSLTQDGRDRSAGHKRLGLHAAPGSKEADFVEQVAPQGDELIINKTSSGAFASSNIYYVLKNLEIDSLFLTGVYTDECISTTARDASDLGFLVTLISDGCTTVTRQRHEFTLATLSDRYTRILTTEQAMSEIIRLSGESTVDTTGAQKA